MRFSQRLGFSPVRTSIQTDSMDEPLRNSLWNVLQILVWDSHKNRTPYNYTTNSSLYPLLRSYWIKHFTLPVDELPDHFGEAIDSIRRHFFETEWYKAYDFIEFTAHELTESKRLFIVGCNKALEREKSGYRFIDDVIAPIIDSNEIEALEEAATSKNLPGARQHIQQALRLLADRASPDYRNSIKESISAVESSVRYISGDPSANLGQALSKLAKSKPLHASFDKGLRQLYGYTSDAEGIRHAIMDKPNVTFSDAKFMLVICSAFVNYLAEQSNEEHG